MLDQVSGVRVDDEDGTADGVDDDDPAVGGRGQAGGDVDEPDADAANEVAAVVENLLDEELLTFLAPEADFRCERDLLNENNIL